MKLLFKQRLLSWFGSFDIFDEAGQIVYTVKGQPSWGRCLKIYDAGDTEIGTVQQKLLSWLPRYELYLGEQYVGEICKELTLFRPKFHIDFCGWQVEGNWPEWDYTILDANGQKVAWLTKEIWNWTDTYVIEVVEPGHSLCALMLVLAIDAEKASRST